MITLEPLSERNLAAATRLEVAFDRAGFVAPNIFSIAESKIYNYLQPRVVFAQGRPVGFALYGLEPESQRYHIVRLMISAPYQRRGLGSETLRLLVREIVARTPSQPVFARLDERDTAARRLYERAGFEKTGNMDGDGASLYCLDEVKAARIAGACEATPDGTPAPAQPH